MATGGWAAAPSAAAVQAGASCLSAAWISRLARRPAARKQVSPRSSGKGIRPGLAGSWAAHSSASGSLASAASRLEDVDRSGIGGHRHASVGGRGRRVDVSLQGDGLGQARAAASIRPPRTGSSGRPATNCPHARLTATRRQSPSSTGGAEIAPGSWPRGKTWRQRRPLAVQHKKVVVVGQLEDELVLWIDGGGQAAAVAAIARSPRRRRWPASSITRRPSRVATSTRSSATTGSAENGDRIGCRHCRRPVAVSTRWISRRASPCGAAARTTSLPALCLSAAGKAPSPPPARFQPTNFRQRTLPSAASRRVDGAAGGGKDHASGRLRRGRGELALRQQRHGGRLGRRRFFPPAPPWPPNGRPPARPRRCSARRWPVRRRGRGRDRRQAGPSRAA